MKEQLKGDSKSRQAEYEEPFAEQPAAAAVVFRLPSRRCSGLNGQDQDEPEDLILATSY